MAKAGTIELALLDGADHFFRDLYAKELVDRAMEFIAKEGVTALASHCLSALTNANSAGSSHSLPPMAL